MWHCLSHHFLWASVIFVGLEFAEFVAKISNWNFFVVSFFPIETSLQKSIANQLTVNFKHINSSFTMAFILLWQKREKLVICHQPLLLPKLPFTIGELFTILEVCLFAINQLFWVDRVLADCLPYQLDLIFCCFVAYIIEYVTTDCQVFTVYPFIILIQPHAYKDLWYNW